MEPRLDAWLSALEHAGGEGLLLTAGCKPLLRVAGALVELHAADPLTGEEIEVIARAQIQDQYGDRLHRGREVDFSFDWRARARIRGTAFYQRNTCSLTLRWVPSHVPSLDDLGLPPVVSSVLGSEGGLVVVAGPARSGKSTTLAAMVEWVNSRRACHVVTIEDPIEFVHANRRAVISQREVGSDTQSFLSGVAAARREDADVVAVGDIGRFDTVPAVAALAESGRLVLGGFTCDVAGGPEVVTERLVNLCVPEQQVQVRAQLAASLLAVVRPRTAPLTGTEPREEQERRANAADCAPGVPARSVLATPA